MRKQLLALTVLLSAALHGQTAIDTNLGSVLSVDNSTTETIYTFSWWGKSGMHYIAESSPDLVNWTFFADFNPAGTDAVLGVQFETDASRYFFRAIQFDPDDISGLADTDADGLPDKWERYYFGNLDRDGSGDWNDDGLLDRDAFRFGLNPKGDDESQVTGKFDSFNYDARGWLDGLSLTGSSSVSFGLDDEGNIETAN